MIANKHIPLVVSLVVMFGCASYRAPGTFDNEEQPYQEEQSYKEDIPEADNAASESKLKLAWEKPVQYPSWAQRVLSEKKSKTFVFDQASPLQKLQIDNKESTRGDKTGIMGKPEFLAAGSPENNMNGTSLPVIEQPQGRMVHYDGSITQRSARPEAVLDSAIHYVRSLGGELEKRDNQSATLRIPVEKFRAAFDSLLKFAEVLDKSISALDITESFRDNELRIKIARATIERLKAILLKTEKDEEKIRLLNEIKRLSETLEGLERQRQTLQTSADFSTLKLSVMPYFPAAARYASNEITGFRWIKGLTPFKPESRKHGDYLKLGIPKGMVLVDADYRWGKLWRVSSADGAEYWSGRRKNIPMGDTEFWLAALKERMYSEFADVDTMTAGNYKILTLRSYGAEPYVYLVGIYAHEKDLDVVEAYFPSQVQKDRFQKDIISSIAGGAL